MMISVRFECEAASNEEAVQFMGWAAEAIEHGETEVGNYSNSDWRFTLTEVEDGKCLACGLRNCICVPVDDYETEEE